MNASESLNTARVIATPTLRKPLIYKGRRLGLSFFTHDLMHFNHHLIALGRSLCAPIKLHASRIHRAIFIVAQIHPGTIIHRPGHQDTCPVFNAPFFKWEIMHLL